MKQLILFLSMIFMHIVDDYYLQGILAQMKQRTWWRENWPQEQYKHDYIMALIEHAFSWTFMVHAPIFLWMVIYNVSKSIGYVMIIFLCHVIIHVVTDDAKANFYNINLIQDQLIHLFQILLIYSCYLTVIMI